MDWKSYRNKILQTVDPEAFYMDELKKVDPALRRHGFELKCRCPFPDRHLAGRDSEPSFTVNVQTGVYFCNACGSKGNIHTFLCETRHLNNADGWYVLGDELGIERPVDTDSRPLIDPGLPGQYHKALMESSGVIRDVLREGRGMTDETLGRFMIGWDGERVTIPIYDETGELVNIRRYKWNSYENNTKMINYVGVMGDTHGENRIFGIEHLVNNDMPTVVWCEGEWDRLVLEQNGIPACTGTAGANNLRIEWLQMLRSKKRIYICYDNDKAGREATATLVEQLLGHTQIYVVNWPEDFKEKGDPTDWFVGLGRDRDSFRALFKPYAPTEEVSTVALAQSAAPRYLGKRVRIPVLVAGKDQTPYAYPKDITFTCEHYEPENKRCSGCAIGYKKRIDQSYTAQDAGMLLLINRTDSQQKEELKKRVGINTRCNLMDINVKATGTIEAIHMVPKADAGFGFALKQEYTARGGYTLSHNLQTNKRYNMLGYVHADPNNQLVTYLFDQFIPEKDLAETFELSDHAIECLKLFQKTEEQSVTEKFEEIHNDLERNVTFIWDRRKVAYAVDLVYHSALTFNFQGQPVKRGWAECLIIGDSGQAKTTLVERLMQHYKAGELLSGESSRRTGLVYSLQQATSKSSWSVIWGAMPLNDGGLITVDELSGISEDDLAKMSDVRSSGIAKATGVVIAETTARTRIIFISNPRNGRRLRTEPFGVSAILKLWGKTEDVRRLDFAVTVASGEVDTSLVNLAVSSVPNVPHIYTSEACHLRVMWAWSRKPEDIVFTDEATEAILDAAVAMGKAYSSKIPLVEPADQRLKIARLSVAVAACLVSTDETWTKVIVKAEHVEFVYAYLQMLYTEKSMSYDKFSLDEFSISDASDDTLQVLRESFLGLPLMEDVFIEIVKALYRNPYFSRIQFKDATGLNEDDFAPMLQFMLSNSIIEQAGANYKITELGRTFIEQILTEQPTTEEIQQCRARRFRRQEI